MHVYLDIQCCFFTVLFMNMQEKFFCANLLGHHLDGGSLPKGTFLVVTVLSIIPPVTQVILLK